MLYWPQYKYLTTVSGEEKTYNFNYAMAIQIVGSIVKKDSCSSESCCHVGVKYISKEVGVTKREVKSLKCSFRKECNDIESYVYRISYNAAKILDCIIDVFERNKENKLVKKFLNKNKDFELYRTILIAREYMAVRDIYNRLADSERSKEKKLCKLYSEFSMLR